MHSKVQVTSVVDGSTFCTVATNVVEVVEPAWTTGLAGEMEMLAGRIAMVTAAVACGFGGASAVAVTVMLGSDGMVGGAI